MYDRDGRLNRALNEGLDTQERYELLISELATLRLNKVIQYGEGRFKEPYLPIKQSKALLWANLQRKFQRATHELIDHPDRVISKQDYLDLANYALMVLEVADQEGWEINSAR